MKDLKSEFMEYAAEEGSQTALDELQRIQSSLETICECGSEIQARLAAQLLSDVNESIKAIVANVAAA